MPGLETNNPSLHQTQGGSDGWGDLFSKGPQRVDDVVVFAAEPFDSGLQVGLFDRDLGQDAGCFEVVDCLRVEGVK